MIDIKRNTTTILSVPLSDKATHKKELMAQNAVSLDFVLADYKDLKKGDYIVYETLTYKLTSDYIPTIDKATNGYVYQLEFHGIEKQMEDYLLMFTNNSLLEADFNLTANLSTHLDIVVASLTRAGLGTFTHSQTVTDVKHIQYSNLSILEGLQLIADTYELDWWVDGTVIHVENCELGTEVILTYDQELDAIDYNQSSEKMITRLYAYGSTKNLPANYDTVSGAVGVSADKRLRMRIDDSIPAQEGTAVDYIELEGQPIIEGVQVFDDVFPKQSNTITHTEFTKIDATDKTLETYIWRFRDSNGLVLTETDIQAGQPLKVSFTSGKLNGREFEIILKVISNVTWYEIKYVQEGNLVIPNDVLKPEVGNTYTLFNFNPTGALAGLVLTAEKALYTKAKEYLNQIGHELTYTVKTRSIYCENNTIDLGIGQKVQLTIDYDNVQKVVHSRILSFEKNLNNKYEATYTIGDSKRYSRLNEITKKIEDKPNTRDITGLSGTITNALYDLKLNDAERAAMGETLRTLQSERNAYLATVEALKANVLFINQTNLNTDWSTYDTAINTLISEINRVRALQLITVTDRTSIDTKLSEYNTALSNLITEIENAREAIKTNTIDNIQVGGRNLVRKGGELVINSDYPTKSYDLSETTIIGEIYTYQIKGELAEGQAAWLFYGSDWIPFGMMWYDEKYDSVRGIYYGTFTATRAINSISVFSYPEVAGDAKIEWVKLEKGNKATDWTPAPEDVEAAIFETKLYIQYSADGTNWHDNYQTGDVYLRQKIGANSSWGASIKFVGADGTSITIKGHVANFAALPTSGMSVGDGYVTDDNGHLCVYMPDLTWSDVGTFRGTDGLPSYVHIAYASDANGTNFSTSDPTNRDWIGVCSDHIAIDPDTYQSYTWKYVKGQKGDEGKAAYTVLLTNENHNFMGDKVGALPTNIIVEVIAIKGAIKIASDLPTSITGVTGLTISEIVDGTASENGSFKVTVTNALATGGTIDIPITIDGVSFTKTFTYSVSLEGQDGIGENAKDIKLSATSQILKRATNGIFTPTTTQITAVLQNVLQSELAWTYSENGGAYYATPPNGVTINGDVRVLTAANMTANTITFKATNGTLYDSITVAKVIDGNSATVYELVSSSYISNKNITGAYNPATLVFSALKTVGNDTPTAYSGRYKIYLNGSDTATYTSSADEASKSYTIPANTTSIKVELYLAGGTSTKIDETTIAISNDGQIGQAGKNALNCFLSNSAHGIPCNKDGQPLSYTASGTEIYVQEGDNYLDFVASLTGNSQFTVTSSASGITRGSIIDSSTPNRATVTDHSAMTTNPASITYTIIANNSQGFQSTFKLVQTFTKTLVGATGDAGRGVSSVRPLYYLHTSKTTAPTLPSSPSTLNGWTPTAPAWEVDKYLWRTEEITYTIAPLYVYTTATVDTSWEAVNEINIGGVNLMRNGNFMEGQNNWILNYTYGETVPLFAREVSGSNVPEGVVAIGKITTYATWQGIWQQHREIDKLQLGKYYTVSCIAKSGSGNTTLRFGIDGTTKDVTLTTSWVRYIFTFKSIAHQNFVFYLGGAGVFYISNIQLEEGNQATAFKSGYLESVIQGIVETNGGLLLGNLLGAKDSAGFVRSYMSGVSTNPTAFAAGVQNFGAGNETRNIDIRHNGTAKFGKLEVDELGTIFIVDENGKRRFELNKDALPQISTITSQSSINTDYTSNSVSVTTTTSGTCSATAPVTVAGSTLYVYIEANTFANIAAFGDSATAELKIYLRKNGSATGQVLLLSLRSDAYWTQTTFLPIPDEGMEPQEPITIERKNLTDSDTLFIDNMAFPNIELGTYSIYYEFTRTVSGTGTRTTQGNINDVNLRISYSADKTQLIIGKDGLLAYYGANKYVSINQTDANQPFVRMEGKISIPALVYATTSPPSSISVGGAFAGTGHTRNSSSTIIYHTIGDTNYTAIITPTAGGTHDFYVYTKAPTYIIISGTGTYDITLIRTI